MKDILMQLLSIPSPTREEKQITNFLKLWINRHAKPKFVKEYQDSLIVGFPSKPSRPHVVFVGHTDVVPQFFTPTIVDSFCYGAGASDMKGALAVYLWMMQHYVQQFDYTLSFIFYAREEGTPIEENGLYSLINQYPDFFKTIDLAIVGEPTDNTIQLGCMGSIHARIQVPGQACHSARPWQGKNALYEALPLIQFFANQKPEKVTLFGVDFFDIATLTEAFSESRRTSVPGYMNFNLNYRFSPLYTLQEAVDRIYSWRNLFPNTQWDITDQVPAGNVIQSVLFEEVVHKLNVEIGAKQAWTDVAQLTALGIPAFNFGPGRQDQAHKKDEYINLNDMQDYLRFFDPFILK